MKYLYGTIILLCISLATPDCYAGFFDDLFKGVTPASQEVAPDNSTLVNGLKEALSIGTKNAVNSVGSVDGYFKNQMIKILLPKKFVMWQICWARSVTSHRWTILS